MADRIDKTSDLFRWPEYHGLIKKGCYLTKDSTIKDASFMPDRAAVVVENEDNRYVLGIVRLSEMYRKAMSGCSCMDKITPFVEDAFTHRVDDGFNSLVGRYLDKRSVFHQEDITVITYYDNSYLGTIEIRDILDIIEKKRYQEALFSNPLTGLPGKPLIEEMIKKRRGQYMCLVDLSDFKAYNDKYGVGKGDDILKYTATLLVKEFSPEGVVCHIGGDDFFCVHPSIEKVAERVTTKFDIEIRDFYDPDDVGDGFISSKDRHGEIARFPIMTVSFSITNSGDYDSYVLITHSLASVKKFAKLESKRLLKSVYVFEKRGIDSR